MSRNTNPARGEAAGLGKLDHPARAIKPEFTSHSDSQASIPRRGIIGGVHCAVMPRWAQPLPQKDETVRIELFRVVMFASKYSDNGEKILAALVEALREVEDIIAAYVQRLQRNRQAAR
jgi:hypothetical protein